MARCAVPVAERRVRRRTRTSPAHDLPPSFRPSLRCGRGQPGGLSLPFTRWPADVPLRPVASLDKRFRRWKFSGALRNYFMMADGHRIVQVVPALLDAGCGESFIPPRLSGGAERNRQPLRSLVRCRLPNRQPVRNPLRSHLRNQNQRRSCRRSHLQFRNHQRNTFRSLLRNQNHLRNTFRTDLRFKNHRRTKLRSPLRFAQFRPCRRKSMIYPHLTDFYAISPSLPNHNHQRKDSYALPPIAQ